MDSYCQRVQATIESFYSTEEDDPSPRGSNRHQQVHPSPSMQEDLVDINQNFQNQRIVQSAQKQVGKYLEVQDIGMYIQQVDIKNLGTQQGHINLDTSGIQMKGTQEDRSQGTDDEDDDVASETSYASRIDLKQIKQEHYENLANKETRSGNNNNINSNNTSHDNCKFNSNFHSNSCSKVPQGSSVRNDKDTMLGQKANIKEFQYSQVQEGDLIYDYTWYPWATTQDPQSLCFASTTRGFPVHLWDAHEQSLRCTYKFYNDLDEIGWPYSIAFNDLGDQIFCGYKDFIVIFQTERPGRHFEKISTWKKKEGGVSGINSCFAFSQYNQDVMAIGSYKGKIGLYSRTDIQLQLVLEGHTGGITQIQFTPCGNFLVSGARQDSKLICWDIRNTFEPLYVFDRNTPTTTQRIQFDIQQNGKYLLSGSQDGGYTCYDLQSGDTVNYFKESDVAVNGVQANPLYPVVAITTGERLKPNEDQQYFKQDNSSNNNKYIHTQGSQQQDILQQQNKNLGPKQSQNFVMLQKFQYQKQMIQQDHFLEVQ